MTTKRTWKVEVKDRRKNDNVHWDFSSDLEGTRILDIMWTDNPNKLSKYNRICYMTITRDTYDGCTDEFDGQLSDGCFEDYPLDSIGRVWEVL